MPLLYTQQVFSAQWAREDWGGGGGGGGEKEGGWIGQFLTTLANYPTKWPSNDIMSNYFSENLIMWVFPEQHHYKDIVIVAELSNQIIILSNQN